MKRTIKVSSPTLLVDSVVSNSKQNLAVSVIIFNNGEKTK